MGIHVAYMAGMSSLRSSAIALLATGLAVAGAAGCSSSDSSSTSATSAVSSAGFDKDNVLDDASLVDVAAMNEAQIQAFLEKTPWGTRSGLADYAVGSKSAAALLHDAAAANGINPLVMLVRLQMEEGLIHAKDVPESRVAVAFGCGCESATSCDEKYLGFANQATCMARTLRRDMDRLTAGEIGRASCRERV